MLDYTFAIISRSALGINHKFGENHYLEPLLGLLNMGETAKSYTASFFAATYDFLPITKYLSFLQFFTAVKHLNAIRAKISVSFYFFN